MKTQLLTYPRSSAVIMPVTVLLTTETAPTAGTAGTAGRRVPGSYRGGHKAPGFMPERAYLKARGLSVKRCLAKLVWRVYVTLLLVLPPALLPPEAHAVVQPVHDSKLSDQSAAQHRSILEQWTAKARRDATALERQLSALQIAEQHTRLDHKDGWKQVRALGGDAVVLLKAGVSTWDAYAKLTAYLAAHLEAATTLSCVSSGNCTLAEIKEQLARTELDTVLTASRRAGEERAYLQSVQDELLTLMLEGESDKGLSNQVDTLVKISAVSAQALHSLNRQVNTLISLTSNRKLNDLLVGLSEIREEERFVSSGYTYGNTHIPLRINLESR